MSLLTIERPTSAASSNEQVSVDKSLPNIKSRLTLYDC